MESSRTILVQFIIMLVIIESSHSKAALRSNPSDILPGLAEKDSKKTLIVLVDTDKQARSADHEKNYRNNDRYSISDTDALNGINNALVKANYQSVLFDILRSNKSPNNLEEKEAQERLIEQALRSRCQLKVQCEEKCSRSQERKPKQERYCQKSCKAVYDYLIKCPPPGNKNKDNNTKDKCGKKGKTCPPSWK